MRLLKTLNHPTLHASLTNINVDDHHLRPFTISDSETALVVPPLPGDPKNWDIAIPFDTQAVIFHIRSNWRTEQVGGVAGVTGVAGRSPFYSSAASLGGNSSLGSGAYHAIYTKATGALYLSHKVFNGPIGNYIALTEAYIEITGPSTRVFRTRWTNYGFSNQTLQAWIELGLFG